ncbi:hypothetical protein HJC23_000089 [Cyclotella cryptica]|uniref:Uncharacterized protein n=1 Tax=Cyclotella cryptica TaxID=29204 RepID=A0ABD3NI16_9STRA
MKMTSPRLKTRFVVGFLVIFQRTKSLAVIQDPQRESVGKWLQVKDHVKDLNATPRRNAVGQLDSSIIRALSLARWNVEHVVRFDHFAKEQTDTSFSFRPSIMKKTRDRELAKALTQANNNHAGASTNDVAKKMTKSQSASISEKGGPTSPAVQSRIQQMIAMQKAQNATMRQLMSTGCGGVGSASPSGLRDLVKVTSGPVPLEVRGVAEREAAAAASVYAPMAPVTVKMEPIKPPAVHRTGESSGGDGGIHYQGSSHRTIRSNNSAFHAPSNSGVLPPGALPTNPYDSAIAQPAITKTTLLSTPPHPNPKPSIFASDSSSCDSPVSSTPATVRERKRMQQQLQTIASQEQIMAEDGGGTSSTLGMEQPLVSQGVVQQFDWESVGVTRNQDYVPLMPYRSNGADYPQQAYGYGATSMATTTTEHNKRNSLTESQQAAQPSFHHNRKATGLECHGEGAVIILTHDNPPPSTVSHTQHHFHYGGRGSGVGEPPASVNVRSEFDYHSAYHEGHSLTHGGFHCLYGNEQFGRSFCFGAIDGMLTGAGILSACIGLGLLPHRARVIDLTIGTEESMHTEWILIALTLAACFSDGICMAIGHVWSTRLVAGASYEERKEELRHFETSRSEAKARLVDSLLSKGMLKIDAMSLADTLEGYPDMFVSALLGEGICGQGNNTVHGMSGMGSGGGGGGSLIRVPSGGASIPSQRHDIPRHHPVSNVWDIPPPSYGPGAMHQGLKYESYSDFSDYQQDPDLKTFTETVSDSRLEGFFMMISFGSFSVIPIVIYSFLPLVLDYIVTYTGDPNKVLRYNHPPRHSMLITIFLTTIIMFLLGAWKR